jgi:hypothetical protein
MAAWWKKSNLEEAHALEELEEARAPEGPGARESAREATDDLAARTESLERASATEHTRAVSLNIRATALGGGSAVAILLLAQFSALWLDDNSWSLDDLWDTVLQILLLVTVVAFGLASLFALFALWPRPGSAAARRDRIDSIVAGADAEQADLLLGIVDRLRATNETRSRVLRLASVLFAIALVGTVAQSMIFAFGAEPADGPRTDAPADPEADASDLPSAEDQIRLARLYAPRVWLHTAERFGPLEPASFIRESELGWHLHRTTRKVESRGQVVLSRLGRKCRDAPAGCYAFNDYLAHEHTRPYSTRAKRPRGLAPRRGFVLNVKDSARSGQSRRNPEVPVYFEFRRTSDELLLTYWFFYGYSRPHVLGGVGGAEAEALKKNLSHEGDWESIDVALSPDGTNPLGVYLYGHGTPTRVPWEQVCTVDSDPAACRLGPPGHPVVFSALDSHASYAKAGQTKVCGPLGCAVDRRDQGWRWDTWSAEDGVRPVRSEPWYGFGGAWGAAGTVSDTTGPLGPRAGKLPADPDPGELSPVASARA